MWDIWAFALLAYKSKVNPFLCSWSTKVAWFTFREALRLVKIYPAQQSSDAWHEHQFKPKNPGISYLGTHHLCNYKHKAFIKQNYYCQNTFWKCKSWGWLVCFFIWPFVTSSYEKRFQMCIDLSFHVPRRDCSDCRMLVLGNYDKSQNYKVNGGKVNLHTSFDSLSEYTTVFDFCLKVFKGGNWNISWFDEIFHFCFFTDTLWGFSNLHWYNLAWGLLICTRLDDFCEGQKYVKSIKPASYYTKSLCEHCLWIVFENSLRKHFRS